MTDTGRFKHLIERLDSSDQDVVIRKAFRDPEGFQIIGEELLLPAVDVVRRLLRATCSPPGPADILHSTVVVPVYCDADGTEDNMGMVLSELAGNFVGTIRQACVQHSVTMIHRAQTESFKGEAGGVAFRGWMVTAHVRRRYPQGL